MDQWSPGYSWLAAIGISLTGDLYYAVILNDVFFALLQLVSATWLISLLPGISSHAKMLWFCAFALNTNLVTTNTSTDTAAMGGYTLALACVLYSIQQPKGFLWAGLTAGIALTFCLIMRHAYLPQAFLIPAILALVFLIEKNKDQVKFLMVVTITLLTGFAVYFLLSPGNRILPRYIDQEAKGFFSWKLN
jgi:4-amino-4-deoxy-L-arabinose transferase-like glycosyltransferase